MRRTAPHTGNGHTQHPPPISAKRAQFLRVATPRLAAVVFEMEKLAMTADRNRHEIYDSDVAHIESKIGDAFTDLMERFRTGRRRPLVDFPDPHKE